MDANKRRLLGRPKRGKANQVTRTEAFLKRQRECCWAPSSCMLKSRNPIQGDKSWLETHIWHAKRARMQNMWGYRLVCCTTLERAPVDEFPPQAVTPTEKAFRPSHRASMHGSILHDASYYATIELKGPQLLLLAVLEQCCDPQVSEMKRFVIRIRSVSCN